MSVDHDLQMVADAIRYRRLAEAALKKIHNTDGPFQEEQIFHMSLLVCITENVSFIGNAIQED